MVLEGFYTLFIHLSYVQLLIHVCKTDSSWIPKAYNVLLNLFFFSRLFCYEIVLNLIVSFDMQTFSPAELPCHFKGFVPLFCHTCLHWFFLGAPKNPRHKRLLIPCYSNLSAKQYYSEMIGFVVLKENALD